MVGFAGPNGSFNRAAPADRHDDPIIEDVRDEAARSRPHRAGRHPRDATSVAGRHSPFRPASPRRPEEGDLEMLKVAIAVVLLAHGIGHSMGLIQMFKVATVNPAWKGDSWLLADAGSTITQALGVVVWVGAIIGFTAVAGVVLGWLPASWWAPLAVGSALISIAGLVLFPVAFPTFSSVGALVVNVAVLAAVLWYHWAPADLTA
jgi:hypothetical protein